MKTSTRSHGIRRTTAAERARLLAAFAGILHPHIYEHVNPATKKTRRKTSTKRE